VKLGLVAVVCLVACGPGQLFGPGSKMPADLQAEAECVTAQLVAGNTNVVNIAMVCSAQENQAFSDLVSWLVTSLESKGTLAPAKAASVRANLAARSDK
jgi:hypothetical protein